MKIIGRERRRSFRRVRVRFGAGAGIIILGGFLFSLSSAVLAASAFLLSGENSCALLISPKFPSPGDALRILAAGCENLKEAEIVLSGPSGRVRALKSRSGGGPPFWRIAEFKTAGEGVYSISLIDGKKTFIRQEIHMTPATPSRRAIASSSAWPNERGWDRKLEALYSAWIETLFLDADERSSWPSLHEITRDPNRNILHNRFGLGEDDPVGKNQVIMEPDCADNPFYLRAYFAWKLGLPFGFHECDRGWVGRAPRTGRWTTNSSWPGRVNPVQAFNGLLRGAMNAVHSGTARTRLDDDSSDYYPLPLTRHALRPGVVFADPYGHTLVVVRWVPQKEDRPGSLLAADAQPDGTVAVKRFWRGNFLFATAEVVGEPGFKAFRPIVTEGGRPRALKNSEIAGSREYGDCSLQQKKMDGAIFYDTMDRLINPEPLDPERALDDMIKALREQLLVRVNSVANGEAYMKAHPGVIVPMPSNAAGLFQAGGLWEDFSTPNRDLRLLIAIDTFLDFPDKLVRSPGSFRMPRRTSPEEIKRKVSALQMKRTRDLSITYVRSDGNEQKLTIEEILKRKEAFEIGYNPNDCVEIRWGAPEGSVEIAACRRRAPAPQRTRMASFRSWFQKRLHPPT